jgi:diaminopimelate epimerase
MPWDDGRVADYPFVKGHGTENDFVLLPDLDGSIHGGLTDDEMAERVRRLCDRHAGIGGDGVLRVVSSSPSVEVRGAPATSLETTRPAFFMDYRNADGSLAEMCGNGIRVFVRYLVEEGLADAGMPIDVGTRDGVKTLTLDGDQVTVDLGRPQVLPETKVSVGATTWPATHVDMGNPHAVAFVGDEATLAALDLTRPPEHDATVYPDGVNVELVVRRGERHLAMRVHERGSGETRSCGTGAGAVLVAAATADGAAKPATYRLDVPGGTLSLTWTEDDHVLLTGPAVLTARGTTSL